MKRKKAKRFIDVIAQPVKTNYMILPPVPNIHGYQNVFAALRDRTEDEESKFFYNRCCAILDWAKKCNGELEKNLEFEDSEVIFYFNFRDLKSLVKFEEEYDNQISNLEM